MPTQSPFSVPIRRQSVTNRAQLQQKGRVIVRAASSGRGRTHDAKAAQFEIIHKAIDDANEMVFADPVFQLVRKKHRLTPVNTLNETRHHNPRYLAEVYHGSVFPHSLGR